VTTPDAPKPEPPERVTLYCAHGQTWSSVYEADGVKRFDYVLASAYDKLAEELRDAPIGTATGHAAVTKLTADNARLAEENAALREANREQESALVEADHMIEELRLDVARLEHDLAESVRRNLLNVVELSKVAGLVEQIGHELAKLGGG